MTLIFTSEESIRSGRPGYDYMNPTGEVKNVTATCLQSLLELENSITTTPALTGWHARKKFSSQVRWGLESFTQASNYRTKAKPEYQVDITCWPTFWDLFHPRVVSPYYYKVAVEFARLDYFLDLLDTELRNPTLKPTTTAPSIQNYCARRLTNATASLLNACAWVETDTNDRPEYQLNMRMQQLNMDWYGPIEFSNKPQKIRGFTPLPPEETTPDEPLVPPHLVTEESYLQLPLVQQYLASNTAEQQQLLQANPVLPYFLRQAGVNPLPTD